MSDERADWQLPPGVSRATWDYVTSARIASEYDSFHAGHRLLDFDQRFVENLLAATGRPLTVLDLGCGTGRSIQNLLAAGHRAIGVDLSAEMLRTAASKTAQLGEDVADRAAWVRANMVQLEFLADASIDAAICMYSSFGMLRGEENRHRCLLHVRRCLKSDGVLVVHVHNRGNWWLTQEGRRLARRSWLTRARSRGGEESGDRVYAYRGLPQMYLHIFTARELRSLLRNAKMRIRDWVPLNQTSSGPLDRPDLLPHFRAGGYLVVATPC